VSGSENGFDVRGRTIRPGPRLVKTGLSSRPACGEQARSTMLTMQSKLAPRPSSPIRTAQGLSLRGSGPGRSCRSSRADPPSAGSSSTRATARPTPPKRLTSPEPST